VEARASCDPYRSAPLYLALAAPTSPSSHGAQSSSWYQRMPRGSRSDQIGRLRHASEHGSCYRATPNTLPLGCSRHVRFVPQRRLGYSNSRLLTIHSPAATPLSIPVLAPTLNPSRSDQSVATGIRNPRLRRGWFRPSPPASGRDGELGPESAHAAPWTLRSSDLPLNSQTAQELRTQTRQTMTVRDVDKHEQPRATMADRSCDQPRHPAGRPAHAVPLHLYGPGAVSSA
jgi:hypothetical protein